MWPYSNNAHADLDDFGDLELQAQNRAGGRFDVALRGNVLLVLHELVLLVAGLETKLDDWLHSVSDGNVTCGTQRTAAYIHTQSPTH